MPEITDWGTDAHKLNPDMNFDKPQFKHQKSLLSRWEIWLPVQETAGDLFFIDCETPGYRRVRQTRPALSHYFLLHFFLDT